MEVPAITASFGQPGTCGESRLGGGHFFRQTEAVWVGRQNRGSEGGIGDDFKLPEYVLN